VSEGGNQAPVVVAAYELAAELIPVVERFPKSYRFLLGARVLDEVVSMTTCLVEASVTRQRAGLLRRADGHRARLGVLLRMCSDQRLLGVARYGQLAEALVSIGKMLGGWLRSENSR